MHLKPGSRLGNFEIVSGIGVGGMAEVYKAKDLKLGRDVALKVLPQEMAADPSRLRRFEQEARAASALNHPNIVTIYEIGEHEGTCFIAMEYVKGQTLRELLSEGPLPSDKLNRYATQVAGGLAAAHHAGIVHRDLKPENIIISDDGHAKILDFGLAKLLPQEGASSEDFTAERHTVPGALLGTVGYMSPEQARGEDVDHRTDLFALGVLLFEMASGKRAFSGGAAALVIDAILHDTPDVSALDEELGRIVAKALEKDREIRFQSAADVLADLKRRERRADAGKPAHSRGRVESIAVLPLANLSGKPEQEFFADGMTEALITDLAKIDSLKVISRTSVMRFKGSDKPLPVIARELGVDAILEGSVLRAGDEVRITAQLIHAASDTHLWAESYDRNLTNILTLLTEIARAVAREVQIRLTPREETRLRDQKIVDPAAHDAYLRGRYFWNQRGSGLQKSVTYFEEAISKDSRYARAYAGLADAYALLGFYGYAHPTEALPKSKRAALRAIGIDDDLAEAHCSLGYIHTVFDWDMPAAKLEFERALELNPGYIPAHYWYSNWSLAMGRFGDALAQVEGALELDPLSVYGHTHKGVVLVTAKRYKEAEVALKKTLELDPESFTARSTLGLTYHFQARLTESLIELESAVESSERHPWSLWTIGMVYAANGERDLARETVSELESRRENQYVDATFIASIYSLLRETESAIEWARVTLQERSPYFLGIRDGYTSWAFEVMKEEPRLQEILRRSWGEIE